MFACPNLSESLISRFVMAKLKPRENYYEQGSRYVNVSPELNELEWKVQGNKTALKQFELKLSRRNFSKCVTIENCMVSIRLT